MRYFITFACCGSHLHGDESGSVDRIHDVPGSRLAKASPERVAALNRLGIDGLERKRWAGYGKMRTSRKRSATSFRARANQWKSTRGIWYKGPLLNSRGSVEFPSPLYWV